MLQQNNYFYEGLYIASVYATKENKQAQNSTSYKQNADSKCYIISSWKVLKFF